MKCYKCFSVCALILLIQFGESAVTKDKRDLDLDTPLSSWQDKLSHVLDTESQELQMLHELLNEKEREAENDNGKNETPKNKKQSSEKFNVKEEIKSESLSELIEKGILIKLAENSKRMDSMVDFMADLKSVLSEAINVQSKQMKFESEVIELRDEIQFLREELHLLKKEQARMSYSSSPSYENKLHNDETTIEWLKESSKELRNQINDLSKSCNSTTLMQLRQNMDQQTQRQQSDLLAVQKQIEAVQLQQLRQDEQFTETNGNIEDVRSWQTKLGQQFMDSQVNQLTENKEIATNSILEEEEHFLTEALKYSTKQIGSPNHGRHSKKLKAQLREIIKTTKILGEDHYHFNKRLEKLEKRVKIDAFGSPRNGKVGEISELTERLDGIDNQMSQYTLTLQGLSDKFNVISELRESSAQVFSSLENLETRYDQRLTETQTTLAKIEANINAISNSNDDLKEQQKYQNGMIQNVKKEQIETKGRLQKNHLRLASLQSQLLKWSSQKCSNENSESIQNIRISSLESLLKLHKNTSDN